MRSDESGDFWQILGFAAIGAAISGGIEIGAQLIANGGKINSLNTTAIRDAVISGAISGAVGSISGFIPIGNTIGKFVANTVCGGVSAVAGDYATGSIGSISDAKDSFISGAISSMVGSASEAVLSKVNMRKFQNLNRNGKKNILQNNVFKNKSAYRNSNLDDYLDNPSFRKYINRGSTTLSYATSASYDFCARLIVG